MGLLTHPHTSAGASRRTWATASSCTIVGGIDLTPRSRPQFAASSATGRRRWTNGCARVRRCWHARRRRSRRHGAAVRCTFKHVVWCTFRARRCCWCWSCRKEGQAATARPDQPMEQNELSRAEQRTQRKPGRAGSWHSQEEHGQADALCAAGCRALHGHHAAHRAARGQGAVFRDGLAEVLSAPSLPRASARASCASWRSRG